LYSFCQFLGSKNHWEEKYFLNFLISRYVSKKEDFCQFLGSKIITKYGIVSTYSVTFVSQKNLTCLQCDQVLPNNILEELEKADMI